MPVIGEKLVRNLNLFSSLAIKMACVKPLPKLVADGYLLPYDSYENRVAVMNFIKDIPMNPEHRTYELLLEIEHGLWLFREIPVLLLWGMKDWCFTEKFLNRWRLYYPQAKVVKFPEGGHYILEDHGEDIIRSDALAKIS